MHRKPKANTQLRMFEALPMPEHRKANGQFATRLEAALQDAANWKMLYLTEITRKECVATKLRTQQEEINRLKNRLKLYEHD
jgi:hypothetical protein